MKKVLISLLSTCLVLGALELAARQLGAKELNDPRDALTRMFVPDPDMFWALRPGFVGQGQAFLYRWANEPLVINLHGMRGPPVSVKKPEGVKRIVVMGGSHPMGMWVKQSEVYSSLVERQLNERGGNWQVLNAAVAGYTSWQGVVQLREQLLRFSPDIVISDLGHNDGLPRISWGLSRPDHEVQEPSPTIDAVRSALRRSAAYRLVLERLTASQSEEQSRVSPEEHEDHLDAIGGLAAAGGAKTLYMAQFQANVTQPGFIGMAAPTCLFREKQRDAVVEVCALFETRDDLQHLFVDPLHANAIGHGMIADAVVEKLVALGWVK